MKQQQPVKNKHARAHSQLNIKLGKKKIVCEKLKLMSCAPTIQGELTARATLVTTNWTYRYFCLLLLFKLGLKENKKHATKQQRCVFTE